MGFKAISLGAGSAPVTNDLPVRRVNDAEAERIYALLSEGGQVFMPMQETFFASRFGQLRDRFGTSWMIIHDKPMGPPPG